MNAKQKIVAIHPPVNNTTNSTDGATLTTKASEPHGISTGALAGIAIAAVVIIAIIAILTVYFILLKPRRQRKVAQAAAREAEATANATPKPVDPDTPLKAELDVQSPINEMAGHEPEPVPEADGNVLHEMAGERKDGFTEADGDTSHFHEMPANEEVATEMTGLSGPSELEANERRRRVQLYDPPYTPTSKTPVTK